MLRLLHCEERDCYYKFYYYTTVLRRTRMFMFPKSGQMDHYTMMCMSPQFPNDVLQVLHDIHLLNKEDCRWSSGEMITGTVSDTTVVDCEEKLRALMKTMDKEITCEVCHMESTWTDIVKNKTNHLLPICKCCKALLII